MSITYTREVFQSEMIDQKTKEVIGTVSSKYLFDKNGNPVIDPTSITANNPTGRPYIIPADMDFDAILKTYSDQSHTPIDVSQILLDFRTSGNLDLQRTGIDGSHYSVVDENGIFHEGFVSDYTSSASLYFGAVSGALMVPANVAETGGGVLNYINSLSNPSVITSGDYFNNPNNVENIREGLHYYQANISTSPILDTLVKAFDLWADVKYQELHVPFKLVDAMVDLLNKLNNVNPSDRATEWLTGEGLPWAYNASSGLFVPPPPRRDPLVLDLNGDGTISLVSLNQSKTLFDLTGDGMAELTGWVGANDGMLVNDTNNNGTIDNINELFGNQGKDGFVDLAEKMDTNQDGVVNAQDTNFTSLKVWQDSNQDGISQNSELKSLSELGITEIRTASIPVSSSGDLTNVIAKGSFVMNGVDHYAADVNLQINAKITNYVGEYNLSAESVVLPWLRGYGYAKDAQIAYNLDEALQTKAQEMAADPFVARSQFDSFLAQWTGLSKVWQQGSISRSVLTYDDKVWIMENFEGGNEFFKSSIETALKNGKATSNTYNTNYVDTNFNQMKEHYFALFIAQSYLEKAFVGSHYSINQDKMVIDDKATLLASLTEWTNTHSDSKDEALLAKVLVELDAKLNIGLSDFESTIINSDFLQTYKDISNGKYTNVEFLNGVYTAGVGNDLVYGGSGNDIINAGTGNNSVYGDEGNDIITAGTGNDLLYGGTGDDTINSGDGNNSIYGEAGNDILNAGEGTDIIDGGSGDDALYGGYYGADTLTGGTGNDLLEGGYNNDTYIFNKGDGKDQIYDGLFRLGSYDASTRNNSYNAGTDTLKFGEGISQDSIAIIMNGSSLIIDYGDGDQIKITDQSNTNNAIEKFTLSDGNYLTSTDMNLIIQSMTSYASEKNIALNNVDDVRNNQALMQIVSSGWHNA